MPGGGILLDLVTYGSKDKL